MRKRKQPRLSRTMLAAGLAIIAGSVGLVAATPAGALPSGCSLSGFTVTCTYTSGSNAFIVPNGVTTVHVIAVGGQGGSFTSVFGGFGARVTADLAVTPADTLFAVVGGNGVLASGGANGGGSAFDGGGGGASDVRTSQLDLSSRLVVAAGGGGAGAGFTGYGGGGEAGAAGDDGLTTTGTYGAGGGAGGQPGTASSGGAAGAGGSGGEFDGCVGDDGGLGQGGVGSFRRQGSNCVGGGGGGGGGLYGGGGGGGPGDNFGGLAGSGGGGGGSSLVPSGGTSAIDSTAIPEVVISYTAPDIVTPATLDFGSQPIGSTSAAKTVTLSDTGSAAIAVSSVAISGANAGDFAISSDSCSGQSVAPGSSCNVGVTFAPTATGSRTAALTLGDDASDSPQSVALTGTGTTLGDVKVAIGGPSSASTGSQDTYAINVSNSGPSTALNVVMTAQVPSGSKFVGVSTTKGNCTHPASGSTSGTITCSLGDLSSGAAAIDSVSLKITLNAKGGNVVIAAQAYSTAANATPATPDPNLSNNLASLSTTIGKK